MGPDERELVKAGYEQISRGFESARHAIDVGNRYSAKAQQWHRMVKVALWFNLVWTFLNAADTARHIWFPPYHGHGACTDQARELAGGDPKTGRDLPSR